jgi:hypothetical protein
VLLYHWLQVINANSIPTDNPNFEAAGIIVAGAGDYFRCRVRDHEVAPTFFAEQLWSNLHSDR